VNQRLLIAGCLLLLLTACEFHSDRRGPLYYSGAYGTDAYGGVDGSRRQGRDGRDLRGGYTANSGWRE
jgi:hypothetical protein